MKLAISVPLPDPKEGLSAQSIAYWKAKLQGVSPLQLPMDYSRSEPQSQESGSTYFVVDKTLRNQLLILSQKHEVTLYITLLAVFKVLLYRYSTQNDFCIGTVIMGESDNEVTPLRSEFNGTDTFTSFLLQVKNNVLDACENNAAFDEIVSITDRERNLHQNPLFREIFVFSTHAGSPDLKKIGLEQTYFKDHPKPDVILNLVNTATRLQGRVEYTADKYKQETIDRMCEHYVRLLSSVVKNPDENIGSLPMLTPEEEHALLFEFNDTLTAYSQEKTLFNLFEDQVLKTPESVALMQDDLTLSYRELNEHSNRLAWFLIEQGVKSGDNVGLLVTRSFSMVVGMFAILKAGGAYVPIDPEYPLERQTYILGKSDVDLILTDAEYPLTTAKADFQVINFNKVDLDDYGIQNPEITVNSRQLAYTIYTSGSTGLPKGVMIEHHSAVNLIEWVNREFNVGIKDRLLFITSMCFDLSVYDIFGMLASGGSIVIANQQEVMDIEKLKGLLQRFEITFWDSVPTTMNYLVQELISGDAAYKQTALRLVFMSGDWIPVRLPEQIRQYFPNAEVISLGGATEGTVWSNYYPVKKVQSHWTSIPYGKPISNNFFYVLNELLQPVPAGVTGELYIGGVGVARGYADDLQKTDYAFIKDPFNETAGGRMYRTGDLGRMLPDGNLEFLGRKDSQVKIRGYRVELGEIESVLSRCSLVSQSVVVAKVDKEGNKFLIAYIVPEGAFNRKAIILYLKSKVPEYMIPALFVELNKLPLTSNGKIDKKALSDLEIPEPDEDGYEKPQTDSQRKLAAIWQEILTVQKVGLHDNFFELGGHSLIAVKMITRFEKEFGVKLPLAILFKYPTISTLLSFIEKDNTEVNNTWRSLVPIKASGTKMPIYIIHGSGLNVLSFSDIAMHVDDDQPVFGLQARGLNGIEEPSDDMYEIARSYIAEILEHNPSGPYAIAGYSFGGYVAVEMRKQLELMGKKVKMLAIFDTNAVDSDHYKVSTKIKRQVPKFVWFLKSLMKRPKSTISYQLYLVQKKLKNRIVKVQDSKKNEVNDFYARLEEINKKHWYAFRRYNLSPFDDVVYLFRAKERIYFVDDFKYLGWNKFAKKGVKIYEVSGDHRTMLLPPHAKTFARALQEALDIAGSCFLTVCIF